MYTNSRGVACQDVQHRSSRQGWIHCPADYDSHSGLRPQEEAAANERLAAELARGTAELAANAALVTKREAEATHLRAAAAVLQRAHGDTVAALQGQLEAQALQARA